MRRADVDVLIAGGGLAAQRCCETLRRLGFDGRIAMLCEEPSAPYDRPPLSKAVLTDGLQQRELAFRPPAWYAENDVELMLGVAARELDVAGRSVALEGIRRARRGAGRGGRQSDTLRYRRLVIATGSRPRRLPEVACGGPVHELRTDADAQALRAALRDSRGRLVVLGAGLVGMEVASAARALGVEVTLIEAAQTPLARALPPTLGRWLAGLHRAHGVDVRLATSVERVRVRGRIATLELSDGGAVSADTVLVAVGTVPATDWLATSGLAPGSVLTDRCGRTRWPDVYAAGDAACFPDPYLGERVPTQHWEAAVRQGTAVARAILDLEPPDPVPPMFWSDQHSRRIQLVGHTPPQCEIELDGERADTEPFVAWITRAGVPAAALLVNRPDVLPQARTWIAAAHPSEKGALRAA